MSGIVGPMTDLRYRTTVDRTLVHRWSVAEVFLTDLLCDDPGRVEAAAQWPRHHAYFDTGGESYCLLIAAETFRQTTIAALHALDLAAPDDHFIMKHMGVEWNDEPVPVGSRPRDLRVALAMTPAGRAWRFDLTVTISDGDRDVVRGSGLVVVLRPEDYAALRRGRTERQLRVDGPSDIPCSAVGRTRPQDVVLADQGCGSWSLRVDTAHPTIFDHGCDHLPGMLMFEAARQAALLGGGGGGGCGGRQVVSIGAKFGAFMELDASTTVELSQEDRVCTVTLRQEELVGARFRVLVEA